MKHTIFSKFNLKYLYFIFFIIQFSYSFGQPTIKELEELVNTSVADMKSKMPSGYVFENKDELTTYWDNRNLKGGISVTEEYKGNKIQFSFFDENIYNSLFKDFNARTSKCNLREEEEQDNIIFSSICNGFNYRFEILKSGNIVAMYSFIISSEIKIETVNFIPPIPNENQNNNKIEDKTLEEKLFVTKDSYSSNNSDSLSLNKDLIELFNKWESILLQKGIFDYVTKSDCGNIDKMEKLYEKGKYPMHIDSQNFIKCDYNKDKSTDYILNYSLDNCFRGNTWITDFVFFTSKNQEILIDTNLTWILKKKYADYVKKNFGKDEYVYLKNNYIVTHKFIIDKVINGDFYGTFLLLQDGANCCPEISGNFIFNSSSYDFKVNKVEKRE